MQMTAAEISNRLMKLHTENIVRCTIYGSRIAKYRGKPITNWDYNKIESFILIAALSFDMDDALCGLISIVELDVLRQYNTKIYETIDYYKKLGDSQTFNDCAERDLDFFCFFATSRLI